MLQFNAQILQEILNSSEGNFLYRGTLHGPKELVQQKNMNRRFLHSVFPCFRRENQTRRRWKALTGNWLKKEKQWKLLSANSGAEEASLLRELKISTAKNAIDDITTCLLSIRGLCSNLPPASSIRQQNKMNSQ